jgi:uncharacterized membrane protein YedE/YeeE
VTESESETNDFRLRFQKLPFEGRYYWYVDTDLNFGYHMEFLTTPFPWYVSGPLLGLGVVSTYALLNRHLGISGSYAVLLHALRGQRSFNSWRIWFLGGTAIGAALIWLLAGSEQTGMDFGALGERLSLPVLIPFVFLGSVLVGYGARMAGGCTSGHGIAGCATRSSGSLVTVGIFVVAGVFATLTLNAVLGGL